MDLQPIIAVEDGKLITGSRQDCTPFLEAATRKRNEGEHGSKEMRHAASFPPVLVERYCNERGITFSEWLANPIHARVMLMDPDLSGFRIWGGRV